MIFSYVVCANLRGFYMACVTDEDLVNCRKYCRHQMKQYGCRGALGLHLDLSDEGKM
ncbi:hypothetical protein Tsubulata_028744 [Turnera subulata]|uniref:Uncharacterized protein n=1 Tax=Turnera subulata TaxID=218843 RepID=A0A9Q0GP08_9ROSI|nr:hypothetical protein Tsubulata_028744 [Turnera subulata]